jgi:D-arginine dehydrogenase
METARIAIIGGGIAGLATAWFLARRGEKGVVLLERERELGRHSTGLNAAILRTPGRDPVIEAMARRGAEFLRAPPAGFSEVPLLDPCGVLMATAPAGSAMLPWERRLAERDDVEGLPASRAFSVAPHFRAEGLRLWWLPREGRIDNAALVEGFARGARRAGVRIETEASVRELLVAAEGAAAGVRLENGREIRAERTLIGAGGWAERLGRAAGSRVRLQPTRRHLLVTEPDTRVDPRWPVVWVETDPFYARPESGGLLLCGCDEVDVDPDRLAVVPEVRELVLAKAARFLPRFQDARVAHFWNGVRTLTRDGRFVIGPDPDVPGLHWAAGLGGHGMGCAAAVGELAADLLIDGKSARPAAEAFDPARFALDG